MSSTLIVLGEFAVLAAVFGFGLWELWKLRRERARDAAAEKAAREAAEE